MGNNHYRSGENILNKTLVNVTNINFEVKVPWIVAVLGLIIESIERSKPFDMLREKFPNYIVRNVNNIEDLISVLRDII